MARRVLKPLFLGDRRRKLVVRAANLRSADPRAPPTVVAQFAHVPLGRFGPGKEVRDPVGSLVALRGLLLEKLGYARAGRIRGLADRGWSAGEGMVFDHRVLLLVGA